MGILDVLMAIYGIPIIDDPIADPGAITESFSVATLVNILILIILPLIIYGTLTVKIKRLLLTQNIKNKISRDIHDHIGSSLCSVSVLSSVALSVVKTSPQHALDLLKQISITTTTTQEDLDDIIWSIHSENETMSIVIERMREFFLGIFQESPVVLSFQCSDDLKTTSLSLDKRYDLYLIFKEIANNSAKYSKADRIKVHIFQQERRITLRFEDNGVGFDESIVTDGNGLENIRDRAKRLGGQLIIKSEKGIGTQVQLDFPTTKKPMFPDLLKFKSHN
jgi:signal transduction histidine kinase